MHIEYYNSYCYCNRRIPAQSFPLLEVAKEKYLLKQQEEEEKLKLQQQQQEQQQQQQQDDKSPLQQHEQSQNNIQVIVEKFPEEPAVVQARITNIPPQRPNSPILGQLPFPETYGDGESKPHDAYEADYSEEDSEKYSYCAFDNSDRYHQMQLTRAVRGNICLQLQLFLKFVIKHFLLLFL